MHSNYKNAWMDGTEYYAAVQQELTSVVRIPFDKDFQGCRKQLKIEGTENYIISLYGQKLPSYGGTEIVGGWGWGATAHSGSYTYENFIENYTAHLKSLCNYYSFWMCMASSKVYMW